MMQAAQRRRDDEKGKELDASPVKTVLGSLNQAKQDRDPVHKLHRNKISPKKPHSVEDVPFRIEDVPMRRQDKRILNARNRRLNDRKLIICIVLSGIIFLLLGLAALAVFMSFTDEPYLKPLIVIGPILIGCGIITCLCSIEVCARLYVSKKRTADPELDNLVNPHEVKHWMAPELIPYGWGFFSEGKGIDDLADRGRVGAGAPEHNHPIPHILEHQDSQVVIQLEDTLEEADQYIDEEGETLNNTLVDFPHRYVRDNGSAGGQEK